MQTRLVLDRTGLDCETWRDGAKGCTGGEDNVNAKNVGEVGGGSVGWRKWWGERRKGKDMGGRRGGGCGVG